jgi:hypothetical protein
MAVVKCASCAALVDAEATKCPECGDSVTGIVPLPSETAGGASAATGVGLFLVVLGVVLLVLGLALAFYFVAIFDTWVRVPAGDPSGLDHIQNLSMVQDRRNGLILGFGTAVLGGILIVAGIALARPAKTAPVETLALDERSCRYCADCGAQLRSPSPADDTAVCPECAQHVQGGDRFCRQCGHALV